MRRVPLVLVLTSLLAPLTSSASSNPAGLYKALLKTRYAVSELPRGFSGPVTVTPQKPSANAAKHHVLGEARVGVFGPDVDDELLYEVFPSAADALATLRGGGTSTQVHLVGKVPGQTLPSELFVGSLSGGVNANGKKLTLGATVAAVQDGVVLVVVLNDWDRSSKHGNLAAALALLRSGLRHLSAVESSLAHR